jgi:hypothetical protein
MRQLRPLIVEGENYVPRLARKKGTGRDNFAIAKIN